VGKGRRNAGVLRDAGAAVPTRMELTAWARRTDLGLARDRHLEMRMSGKPDMRAPLPTLQRLQIG